jgi:CRISPR/Cas system-associated exonuclease Cas4 (RecB family)
LELNARAEIMALLSSLVSEGLVLEPKEVDFRPQLYPNEKQIGINAPATPDFIVPERRIVGDIKTGTNFLDTFFLSCAGYALTYENQKGAGNDMDFGVIYFFQTRRGSEYAKPVTFAQSYFVVIDDALRDYFINMRNRAYEVVSKPDPPGFPADKTKCGNCPYRVGCEKDGLQL